VSASILWRPISKKVNDITPGAPSAFISKLEAAFGKLPARIGTKDLDVLRGMIAATDGDQAESLHALHGAVETHGEIEVYGAW